MMLHRGYFSLRAKFQDHETGSVDFIGKFGARVSQVCEIGGGDADSACETKWMPVLEWGFVFVR